jgi:hypothetical protein
MMEVAVFLNNNSIRMPLILMEKMISKRTKTKRIKTRKKMRLREKKIRLIKMTIR